MKSWRIVVVGLILALLSVDAWARIKLITLPVRERVEMQLTHPSATLVEEERIVPLVQGANQVDFSWRNSRVDPHSILFRLVEGEGVAAQVLAVSYPPGENALVWDLWAEQAGTARVRIGYLIEGFEREYHYRATADHAEQQLRLQQFLRLRNQANEAFAEAHWKLGFGEPLQRSIGRDETRELLVAEYHEVPISKRYTADLARFGYLEAAQKKLRIPMHYVLQNDAAHGLGAAALPFGKARIFIEDGRGGSAFIGEDWGSFTPRDEEMALYLGVAQDIVVRRTIARNEAQRVNGNLFHYDVVIRYEVENFKEEAVVLDVVEEIRAVRQELGHASQRAIEWQLGSDTTLALPPDGERSGVERLVLRQPLPPRQGDTPPIKQVYTLHLHFRNEW